MGGILNEGPLRWFDKLTTGSAQGDIPCIIYRSGRDTRVNRANIARLKRILQKSTTLLNLEIYYHDPLKLLDWAEPHEHVRYVRLRSDEVFPLAERIAARAANKLLIFDDTLLIAASDVWQLLGHADRNAVTVLNLSRTVADSGEGLARFCFRDARLRLTNYLFAHGGFSPRGFALNKGLLAAEGRFAAGTFAEKSTYAELLRSLAANKPGFLTAYSVAVRQVEGYALLSTGAKTIEAVTTWKSTKVFPWWFNSRLPLFHVAQLAVYYGALVVLISPLSSLIVFLFAVAITPQYFFAALHWRKWQLVPGKLCARFLLYFVG